MMAPPGDMEGTVLFYLASYPRSGNSFVRHLIETLYGLPTYTIDRESSGTADRFWSPYIMDVDLPVWFVKTHRGPPHADTDEAAIHIIRDGRDTLVSHARYIAQNIGVLAPGSSTGFRSILKALILGTGRTGDVEDPIYSWSEHTMAWLERDARTAVVRFEDLIQDPRRVIGGAIRALNLRIHQHKGAHHKDFEELHESDPILYRRGVVGSWRDEMPDDLHELFWEHHGDAMLEAGYGIGGEVEQLEGQECLS